MNTKQFGERVAELRKKCGMTQSQLNLVITKWKIERASIPEKSAADWIT